MKVQKPRGQISHTGCQEKSLTECFPDDYVAASQVQELGCRKKKRVEVFFIPLHLIIERQS